MSNESATHFEIHPKKKKDDDAGTKGYVIGYIEQNDNNCTIYLVGAFVC